MPLVKCPSCVFWRVLDADPGAGNCLCRAPAPIIVTKQIADQLAMGSRMMLPVTPRQHGCGDGELRKGK